MSPLATSLSINQVEQLIEGLSQLPTYTIGRQPDNVIAIPNGKISSKHAQLIQCTPNSFVLVDLDSKNGTFVNGVRIARKVVGKQDSLQLADTNYTLDQLLALVKRDAPEPPKPDFTLLTDIKQNNNACQPGIGWQTFQITSCFPLNAWHHLVFTYTGNTIRTHLDGAQLAVRDNLPANKIDLCRGGDLKFGAQNLLLPWYFYGAMDDVRVYKRALSADAVRTLNTQ